jgi:hypothetical protein
MKFDFIEKTNSNVLVIGDKEQLVVSNFSYQTSVTPTNTKEFRFKVIGQDQALRRCLHQWSFTSSNRRV